MASRAEVLSYNVAVLPLVVAFIIAQATDPLASLTPPDLARGKKLYESWCAGCHGQTGEGGKGSLLAQPNLRRAADNAALVEVILEGVRDSEMPGFWFMSPREAQQVAGYVRSLGRRPVESVPGDPERGRKVYTKAGCAACHIAQGEGAGAGPELTDAGWRRSPAFLRDSIVNPAAAVPEGFAMIRARGPDSRAIEGVRISEDSFTIQIRDDKGRVHSLRKSDLQDLQKQFDKSTMPSYKDSFTPAELDDLVAYLASLRGKI